MTDFGLITQTTANRNNSYAKRRSQRRRHPGAAAALVSEGAQQSADAAGERRLDGHDQLPARRQGHPGRGQSSSSAVHTSCPSTGVRKHGHHGDCQPHAQITTDRQRHRAGDASRAPIAASLTRCPGTPGKRRLQCSFSFDYTEAYTDFPRALRALPDEPGLMGEFVAAWNKVRGSM